MQINTNFQVDQVQLVKAGYYTPETNLGMICKTYTTSDKIRGVVFSDGFIHYFNLPLSNGAVMSTNFTLVGNQKWNYTVISFYSP